MSILPESGEKEELCVHNMGDIQVQALKPAGGKKDAFCVRVGHRLHVFPHLSHNLLLSSKCMHPKPFVWLNLASD